MSDEITLILEDHSDSILVEIVEEVTEVAVAATGEKGPPGTRFYLTDGVPTAALGVTADLALDTTTGILYRKASATTWVEEGTIATGAALTAAAAVLTAAINAEVAARQAADTGLSTQLSEVAADIDAEAAERAAADIAETTARLTTDAGLTAQLVALTDDLADEVTARTAADTGLSNRIDGLAVADISGLVAALAAKATPADISTAIANLVASAPSTLDTLNELAAALGNDPNFATTITTLIGTKASQASLTAEISARAAADTALQAELDDHEARIADLESHPGGVTTFNGRTGAVTPAAGDYAVADITGLPAALDGKMNVGDSAPLLGGTRRLILLAPGVDDTDPGAGKISFSPDTSRLMVSLTDADGHDMTDFAANLGKVAAIVVIHSTNDPSRWIAYRINEVWDVWDTFYTFTVTASKSLSGLTPTDGENVQVYILPSGGGVRYGGATGQVPVKLSDNDFDLGWASVYTQGEIDGLLTAETTARDNADSAEATARAAADTTLQTNINAEATTRAAGDAALGNRVAVLEAGSGSVATGTYLLEGGTVAWVSGRTFRVGAARYVIDGMEYTSAQASVTLDAADASFDRIDVLALTSAGATKVSGVAAAVPFEPVLDPATQLRVTAVTMPAAASTPTIATETVYAENAGTPTEWAASTPNGTINVNATAHPFAGTKHIAGTGVSAGQYFELTRASGIVLDGRTLVFQFDPKAAWPSKKQLRLTLFNGTTQKGTPVVVASGQYGLNTATGGTYQQIVVPYSAFGVAGGTQVTKARVEVIGSGANVSFDFDAAEWQTGTTQAPTGTALPKGGAAGDVLFKNSSVDGDAAFRAILQSDVSGLPAALAAKAAAADVTALDTRVDDLEDARAFSLQSPVQAKGDLIVGVQPPLVDLSMAAAVATWNSGGSTPQNAIDNNPATVAIRGANPVGNYLIIDLGEAIAVGGLRFTQGIFLPPYVHYAQSVRIDYSTDGGVNWTPHHTITGLVGGDSGNVVFTAGIVTARKWRIYGLVDSNSWSSWYIYEVYLRGPSAAYVGRLPVGTDDEILHAASGQTEGLRYSGARTLRETSGPTKLTMGAVADGELLKRVGTSIVGVSAGSAGSASNYSGTGSPEGVVTAPVSSLYIQTNAATAIDGVWYKKTGTGNTGWVQITASSGSGETLITSLSAPSSGIFEFTGLDFSSYKEARIVARRLVVNADAGNPVWPGILLRVGGVWQSSYDVRSGDYAASWSFASEGYPTISLLSVANTLHALSTSSSNYSEGEFRLLDANGNKHKYLRWLYSFVAANGAVSQMVGHARLANNSLIDGIRFYTFRGGLTASNCFASGTVEIYGKP
jgi:hypothetical protein